MNTYKVRTEVTVVVDATDRQQAAKYASEWVGHSSMASTCGANFEWNLKSRRVGITMIDKEQD